MVFQEQKNEDIITFVNKGDEVVGVLEGISPAKWGQQYTLNVNGKRKIVYGTSFLDSRMKNIKLGETIKIVYQGTIPTKKGNPMHVFSVFVDRPEEVIVK